jgi:serine beta-lactamase-like protein LACTB
MIPKHLALSGIMVLISLHVMGQTTLQGKILNSTTQQPVQYANIGIRNKNTGTLSNPDGSFLLTLPASLLSDSLTVSSIGYGNRKISIRYLLQKENRIIYLTEKPAVLTPVSVNTKKEKISRFVLGNADFKGGVLQTDTLYAGRSIALLISNNGSRANEAFAFPAFIESARLRIFRNNLPSFKVRIRLQEVDALTGMPGPDILEKSIVKESNMRNGWLEFGLSDLNLEMAGPFFLTFEQILDLSDRTLIADEYNRFISEHPNKLQVDTILFEGRKEVRQTLKGGGIDLAGTFIGITNTKTAAEQFTCYVRETSLGEWKKVRGILSATASLSKYPGNTAVNLSAGCDETLATCKAEKICKDFMDEHGMNGMQISVSKKNQPVWNANLGYADIMNRIPVTDATKFRINSISKSVTSLALVKLLSEHKIDLDAPVQKYFPEFPEKPAPITIRQLAGHMAGFRDYDESNPDDYIRTVHYENAVQAVKIFENDTLLFKPGSRFHYSTFGWNLIGAIIEKISGKDYLAYMAENIWKPLGLENTYGDNIRTTIPDKSKFYDGTGEENGLGDLSYKYAGGGLLSTGKDLLKIGNEILYGSYIDPKLKKILFETQHTSDGKETGYGLGWYTGRDRNGHRIWYHPGDSFSSSSCLLIYPDDEIVVSFLANAQSGVAFDIEKIGAVFYR